MLHCHQLWHMRLTQGMVHEMCLILIGGLKVALGMAMCEALLAAAKGETQGRKVEHRGHFGAA